MQKQMAENEATGSSRVLRGRAKLESERVRTSEISVETRAVKASLASSEEMCASAHRNSVESEAPDSLAVPQRARGMPSQTTKVVEMGKSAHPMVTRGRTASSAANLPTPAQPAARVSEQKSLEERRTMPTRAKRKRAQTDMVEPNAQDLERQGARPNVSPASESKEELRQKRLILEEDERLDEVEEVDQLLADQQHMQCSDWERAQDADPVI